jgi:diaminopimelate epimerase
MSITAPVPFWKMSGSGNDFILIDNRSGIILPEHASSFTRKACQHRISVGADGVVLIEESSESGVHFRWRYINADGSDGEMCGNGAMCGARFAYLNGIAPADCVFRTASGLVRASVNPAAGSTRVRIAMEDPGPMTRDISVEAAGRSLVLHAIQVGVPHAVLVTDDTEGFAPGAGFVTIGRAVRQHGRFAPAGTNLNVITVLDRGQIRMRTYERGVEDETLACGTGSIASAIVATALGLVDPPVDVTTSSGRILQVGFTWDGARASGVTLGGEARIIVQGTINPEALH